LPTKPGTIIYATLALTQFIFCLLQLPSRSLHRTVRFLPLSCLLAICRKLPQLVDIKVNCLLPRIPSTARRQYPTF
jgi:hypothetical protein